METRLKRRVWYNAEEVRQMLPFSLLPEDASSADDSVSEDSEEEVDARITIRNGGAGDGPNHFQDLGAGGGSNPERGVGDGPNLDQGEVFADEDSDAELVEDEPADNAELNDEMDDVDDVENLTWVEGDRPKPAYQFTGPSGFTQKFLHLTAAVVGPLSVTFFVGLFLSAGIYATMVEETNRHV